MRRLFTGNEDADHNILLTIDDETLFNACKLNKYAKSLCDDNFWLIKVNQLLPGLEFPAEYRGKGEKLYNDVKNINGIADWALLYNHFDLMMSLIKIGKYPKNVYLGSLARQDNYEVIKRFVDYVDANNKLEKLLAFKQSFDYIIYNENIDILKLLLPYSIISIEEIYANIFRRGSAKSLNLILNYITLTQDQVNEAFIEDNSFRFGFSEVLINKDYYPDNEILKELSEKQKIALQKFLDNKNNGNYQPKLQ